MRADSGIYARKNRVNASHEGAILSFLRHL